MALRKSKASKKGIAEPQTCYANFHLYNRVDRGLIRLLLPTLVRLRFALRFWCSSLRLSFHRGFHWMVEEEKVQTVEVTVTRFGLALWQSRPLGLGIFPSGV